jgi:alcohol dehydrogenase (cytochrome c)
LGVAFSIAAACGSTEQAASPDVASPSREAAVAREGTESNRSGNWIAYNGSLSGDRYSPLNQITSANVANLRQICAFDAPEEVSFQSGVVAAEGVLYFTTFNNTYAIDGSTCQQRWKHTRPEPQTMLMVNRGVGYGDGRLFRGTGDAHVLAIDVRDGRLLWDVPLGDASKGESIPMAPIAWNGLVFVGNAGGDNFAVTGRIYALDASSGKTVWQFNTVPDSGPARATWQKASPENPPSGAATWTSYALDEASGILYVTTGNPGPDFAHQLRPGENLYSNSLLALDAKTGRLIAYVQPYKVDFHDWDLAAGPALISTKSGRPSVLAASKDGYVYIIDRAGIGNRANTDPSTTALTVRSRGLAATRENTETPLSDARFTRFCPGSQGGIEWNGPTYHPGHGLLYVNSIDWCTSVKLQPLEQMKGTPGMPWTGMDDPKMAFGRQDPPGQWRGWVTAIDADTGDVKWKVQTPKPMVAGITATAGDVVFTGDLDGNAVAYDAQAGKVLWQHATGKAIGGGVITYEGGGKQHVAVAAGLNSAIWPVKGGPARVVVYALP